MVKAEYFSKKGCNGRSNDITELLSKSLDTLLLLLKQLCALGNLKFTLTAGTFQFS